MEILPSGAEVSREYGLPEGPVLFHQPRGTNKLSSVGRPLPRTWAAIVDPATGEELRDRTEGEIVAKGPQVPLDCEEHARGDGWVATGDLGYRDKDGFFYVTGRLRDTVRLEGLEVSPAEVEQQLTAHPEVADCGLFWRPQGPEPEAAVAVVVARTPSNPPSPKELADFLAARLASYKRISSVVFAEHIPRFPDGRIDRKRLAQENGVRTRVEFVAPTYL
ncbi:hypothetical protein AAG570_010059 [Ranatra chinensis]|uniref:Uncharacterized protein n=1 Tax=Ranatra chinensis TaxID=642074 RepID=A0ABD0YLF7_9HEMI